MYLCVCVCVCVFVCVIYMNVIPTVKITQWCVLILLEIEDNDNHSHSSNNKEKSGVPNPHGKGAQTSSSSGKTSKKSVPAMATLLKKSEEFQVHQQKDMGMGQNLVPLVNIKIAGKWMFIPLKMVSIGIDS